MGYKKGYLFVTFFSFLDLLKGDDRSHSFTPQIREINSRNQSVRVETVSYLKKSNVKTINVSPFPTTILRHNYMS